MCWWGKDNEIRAKRARGAGALGMKHRIFGVSGDEGPKLRGFQMGGPQAVCVFQVTEAATCHFQLTVGKLEKALLDARLKVRREPWVKVGTAALEGGSVLRLCYNFLSKTVQVSFSEQAVSQGHVTLGALSPLSGSP